MIGEGLERYEPALLTTIYVMMYNFRVTMIMLFFFIVVSNLHFLY